MSPKVTNEHKEQRRREILHAAKAVFQRKGFEPTTMKDIVEESGMSRGGVYMYFSSTEEVFRAIFDLLDEDRSLALTKLFAERKTAWETIVQFLNVTRQEIESVRESFAPVIFEYLMTGWREQDRRPYLTQRYEKAINVYTELLHEGIEQGEFKPLLPVKVIAHSLTSFMDGLSLVNLYVGKEVMQLSEQFDALKLFLKQVLQVMESDKQ